MGWDGTGYRVAYMQLGVGVVCLGIMSRLVSDAVFCV